MHTTWATIGECCAGLPSFIGPRHSYLTKTIEHPELRAMNPTSPYDTRATARSSSPARWSGKVWKRKLAQVESGTFLQFSQRIDQCIDTVIFIPNAEIAHLILKVWKKPDMMDPLHGNISRTCLLLRRTLLSE